MKPRYVIGCAFVALGASFGLITMLKLKHGIDLHTLLAMALFAAPGMVAFANDAQWARAMEAAKTLLPLRKS